VVFLQKEYLQQREKGIVYKNVQVSTCRDSQPKDPHVSNRLGYSQQQRIPSKQPTNYMSTTEILNLVTEETDSIVEEADVLLGTDHAEDEIPEEVEPLEELLATEFDDIVHLNFMADAARENNY
jgi:hypothetical protein